MQASQPAAARGEVSKPYFVGGQTSYAHAYFVSQPGKFIYVRTSAEPSKLGIFNSSLVLDSTTYDICNMTYVILNMKYDHCCAKVRGNKMGFNLKILIIIK